MSRNLGIAILVGLGLTVSPAVAAAQSLYATPSPTSGADCSAGSPCGLSTAMGNAVSGDTVVIGAGTYGGSYSDGGKSLTIEGAVIGPGRPVVDGGFELTGPGTRISDVQSTSMKVGDGAEANRVVSINNSFGDGCEIETSGGTIANSLCLTESSFFSGLSTQSTGGSGPMIVRNDTMIGHHGFYSSSVGIVTISDSIAMRNSSASADDASLGNENVNLIRSYALHQYSGQLPKSEEDPLEEEPIFRAAGDYREAAGSPSIDFGSTTAEFGELDLDGNLRKIGAKTDLGAYEFVPDAPSLGTPSATRTSSTSATVSVPINPNSGRTYYRVEYGPTAGYGSSTATFALPAATTPATVEVDLTELPADSTIHYSVVATSDGGGAATADAAVKLKVEEPVAKKEDPVQSSASVSPKKLAPVLRFVGSKGGAPKGQPLLDRSAIKLSTGCGPVACAVTVGGTVKIGSKSFGTLPGPKTPSHWQAGKVGAMKLRVSSKLQASVREYLQANPTARAKIFVTATFVTADGSKATRKLTIPVRPL